MARTIDARTGQSVSISDFPNPPPRTSNPSNLRPRRIDLLATELTRSETTSAGSPTANTNAPPPPEVLGILQTTPTSYTNITIPLTERMTSWGRGLGCTISHPDKKDTRIPKSALKIIFWAPGMEKWLASRQGMVDARRCTHNSQYVHKQMCLGKWRGVKGYERKRRRSALWEGIPGGHCDDLEWQRRKQIGFRGGCTVWGFCACTTSK